MKRRRPPEPIQAAGIVVVWNPPGPLPSYALCLYRAPKERDAMTYRGRRGRQNNAANPQDCRGGREHEWVKVR